MGIHGINKTSKEYTPQAYGVVGINSFIGYRIALDANEWVYSNGSIVMRNMIMTMVDPLISIDREEFIQRLKFNIINFIISLMKYNITLVWCWDGISPPEKSFIRKKRQQARDKLRAKIQEYKSKLENSHVLSRSSDMLIEYKKLICQDIAISPKEMDLLHQMCLDLNFPSLKSKTEGEKLASALAREGLVKAVWSTDTDNYPLGTPLLISGYGGIGQDGFQQLEIVSLQHMIAGYSKYCEWNFGLANLIDLCIMHGTDFNPNIPGIGPKKSLALIKKYGTIDNILQNEPNKEIGILNHLRTREIFEYEASGYDFKSVELNHGNPTRDGFILHTCIEVFDNYIGCIQFISKIPSLSNIILFPGVKGPIIIKKPKFVIVDDE